MTTTADAPLNSYDQTPYESHPFRQMDPQWLASLARLFGLDSAPPSRCSVLELGCAAGGNLIPLAARNPESVYVGVDYSKVQVADGQARIAALGLRNITLHCMSIADVAADIVPAAAPHAGRFDYILTHGVYSWVPPEIRQAILRVSKTLLSPRGIAYVSYNVYPGWKFRELMREAMIFHASRYDGTPAERLGHARGMIEYMQQIARPDSMFRHVLEEEGRVIREGNAYYLQHEYLEDINEPCYFRDFVREANAQGLGYLGESELASMFPVNFGADADQRLANVTNDQVEIEQYLDFLTNRSFRQTLLVHAERTSAVKRQVPAAALEGLAFYGSFQRSQADAALWDARWGGNVRPGSASDLAIVQAFGERYPASLTLIDLREVVAAATGQRGPQQDKALLELLRVFTIRGLVRLRVDPLRTVRAASALPQAETLARIDVGAGRSHAIGPLHETLTLNVIEALLLPKLDGSHGHDQLVEYLIEREAAGAVTFHSPAQERIADPAAIRDCAVEHVALGLRSLAEKGLLVA
jgi:methyltransferase-like protein